MGLRENQLSALTGLIREILPGNAFYASKLAGLDLGSIDSLDAFSKTVPFTTKQELAQDHKENPPFGSNLTYSVETYTRIHQTSGTSGQPMGWLDTPESWDWVVNNWKIVWRECGAKAGESAIFPFSFGPFLGFWAAFEAASEFGLRSVPSGGQSSLERLKMIFRYQPQWLCCTPTYALHLIQVANEEGIDLPDCSINGIIVGGEPGGSIPEVRQRIESGWGGRVFDHHGMTEVGPVTYSDRENPQRLRILHESYLAEVIDPDTGNPVETGAIGELVLSTLGRSGSPLLRYKTGDLVRPISIAGEDPCAFALDGGIVGRADDMVVVRGVNLYPSAVDAVARSFDGLGEYQVLIDQSNSMAQASMRVENLSKEDDSSLSASFEKRLREVFALRIPVEVVKSGVLPQFEMKAKRWKIVSSPGEPKS